ncbi:1-aminocyclopropane-1-carboxylate deaminase/D-cysteine desulfhydrase [Riemerella columbipharyngis]|uniref:1-aminocyclopropane-1-carboxylate deaminase/D-cysteine desulfhydrase, PLP-dependent ACC family n=1 Tax=Riemerella columbipharyngis TaxID=1071918 RepID=A0A1G7BTR9_9FLAO|nr:pyridoxal-phosphate dependent enzyme [Riemerella columbipharyngis]SDE30393.1 1-aminocyclopropane-1-carboxylate deaminase/D-cysteine desulfhydrase, PLP-dependent ACC family [Riemerella columbipharyngis]
MEISKIPIIKIPINKGIEIFIKREDLIDPDISGNKFWKLLHNIKNYLGTHPKEPFIITYGGAFSNHIAATAVLGKKLNIKTLGIIRGEELNRKWHLNPTLKKANENKMDFRFVDRESYRDKHKMTLALQEEFPNALIIPEGGTNHLAVEGIKGMLTSETKYFDYLCSAVGTGGTLAGISKYAEPEQAVIGLKVVNDESLHQRILSLSQRTNFQLEDAHYGGYGKINDELIRFINEFRAKFGIPLDPVYTGKAMMKLMKLIDQNYFEIGSKILMFHTGGLQGIEGANYLLKKQNRTLIDI